MNKIKIISMTVSKPELFEERVNDLIRKLDADNNVINYDYQILFADSTLLCVFNIQKKG